MTIRHLQIFKTVCSVTSITGAAEKLGMTQPAVSLAVRELESYYNTKLFDRVGRKIHLTEAGSTLLRCAENILDQFDDTTAQLRDGGSFKRCRIGVNVSVSETLLCGILDRLEAAIDGIETHIFVGNTREVERELSDGKLDLALADCLTRAADRVLIPFHIGKASAVCSPDYPVKPELTFAELTEQRLLLREAGSGSRTGLEAIAGEHGCVITPTVESTSDLCLQKLAESGRGITILPCELISDAVSSGRLRELTLTDTGLIRRYFLSYSTKRHHTATVQAAIACLTHAGMRDVPPC